MNCRKINIYVNSTYKNKSETNNSFLVGLPDNSIVVNDDEICELSVINFSCYNSFYSCNNNSNYFQLVFRNILGRITNTFDFYLITGLPNLLNIMTDLNNQLSQYLTITYDKVKNKFIFTRTYPSTNPDYYYLYIKCVNSGTFLGFENGVENLITTATLSTIPCNINSITALYINLDGLLFQNNNISNNDYDGFKISNIIFTHTIDVSKNQLITYDNKDGNNNFTFLLNNMYNIKYFKLRCYDQNLNIIDDMPNYYMTLQFNIKKKDNTEQLLKLILDYEKNIYLLLSYIAKL